MQKLVLIIVALAVFSVGGAALAQVSPPPVFCGDLAAFDCAILRESAAVMGEMESMGFDFDMHLSITNLPDMPDSLRLRLNGGGSLVLDLAQVDALSGVPDALLSDPALLPQYMESLVKAISTDATLILHLPQSLVESHSQIDVPFPVKVALEFRLVDGFAYANLDKLAELDDGWLPSGWFGFDLAGLYRAVLEQQNPFETFNPASSMADPALMESYMSIARLEDISLGGQTAAVFDSRLDMGALFASPDYRDELRRALELSIDAMGFTQDEVDLLLDAYAGMLQGLVIHTQNSIGLEDKYVYRSAMSLDWTMDLTAFDRLLGGSLPLPPIRLTMDIQVELHSFNAVPAIGVPQNALIIPLNNWFPARPSA